MAGNQKYRDEIPGLVKGEGNSLCIWIFKFLPYFGILKIIFIFPKTNQSFIKRLAVIFYLILKNTKIRKTDTKRMKKAASSQKIQQRQFNLVKLVDTLYNDPWQVIKRYTDKIPSVAKGEGNGHGFKYHGLERAPLKRYPSSL